MNKAIRIAAIIIAVAVVTIVVVKRKFHAKQYDKALIEQYAHKFGKGLDAAVLQEIQEHNKTAKNYIFALEVENDEVVRHTTPGHIGERVQFATHPHIKEIVHFAQHHNEGVLEYDATNAADACARKTAYVMHVHGDGNAVYVIGQGYCN